ncbi:hypothetical protein F8388_010502 [Cannabis sativa]|uniref:RNase H type-1 domain-containing protein n=1 Tax=Cannabis sativa TaxID=3483 RepID=A0A7J6GPQ7_CANSA|nr:hypothetical protein G4B88_016855 [Cannabis sativa]KAF4384904.1 hypothetical protein F8388_010502 [Cannabis sativa]
MGEEKENVLLKLIDNRYKGLYIAEIQESFGAAGVDAVGIMFVGVGSVGILIAGLGSSGVWVAGLGSTILLSFGVGSSKLLVTGLDSWFGVEVPFLPRRQSSLRGDSSSPEYKDTLCATPSSPHKKNPFQLSNSTPFEEFFPRLHPTPDSQDLQQAVDQFLHVDSPQSRPNPRSSTQSPQFVSSSATDQSNNTAITHAMPYFPVRSTAPIITDSISVSTTIDKGKGKAPMFVPTTRPSRKESGHVINVSCPPPTAAIPSVVRPTFLHAALDHQAGLTGAGFVFKRGYQTVLASQSRRLPGVVSPIFSEGQALLQSLKWCIDSQFTPQVVFSDCLNLVSKVNGD